ncbi:leucine-rich repeat domain-containing protein [Mariniflexile sp. HMF6888]|uniref:leucine-rich repeat domain-containing protein n=1 Tax=Mariniflexile sp. HMF6888 TaxID=3373086 RepID=UPI0037891553
MKKTLTLIAFVFLLTIGCSKDDGPQLSPAKFSIDQSTVDFGEVEVSTQKEIKLTVTNTGEEDLVLKDYSFSGSSAAEFSINAGETEKTVETGKTYEFLVVFKPAETGDKTATLTITSNVGEHKINLLSKSYDPNAIVNIPDVNFKESLLLHGVIYGGDGVSKIDTNDDGEIQVGEALAYKGVIGCYNKSVTDLTGIEAFVNLEKLYIEKNQLTNLDITQNTALKVLSCSFNKLSDLDVSKNTALEELSCEFNQITNLDVSQNTALEQLDCSYNQITGLDVSKNAALEHLECLGNQLTGLDVSQNTALKKLSCAYNSITGLDVSHNTALTTLYCGNNLLTNLDVSKNTALADFSCGENKLANLDISKNTGLIRLDFSYNQLLSIDVSQHTVLEKLYCHNNQLTDLDVSKNTALKELGCILNEFTDLDVSQNTALVELYCYSNNKLSVLNIANGNNLSMTKMYAQDNPNLTCIQKDAGFTPPSDGSWKKDDTASYSNGCF